MVPSDMLCTPPSECDALMAALGAWRRLGLLQRRGVHHPGGEALPHGRRRGDTRVRWWDARAVAPNMRLRGESGLKGRAPVHVGSQTPVL